MFPGRMAPERRLVELTIDGREMGPRAHRRIGRLPGCRKRQKGDKLDWRNEDKLNRR
jgi:hypothetical protein